MQHTIGGGDVSRPQTTQEGAMDTIILNEKYIRSFNHMAHQGHKISLETPVPLGFAELHAYRWTLWYGFVGPYRPKLTSDF